MSDSRVNLTLPAIITTTITTATTTPTTTQRTEFDKMKRKKNETQNKPPK